MDALWEKTDRNRVRIAIFSYFCREIARFCGTRPNRTEP